MPFYTQLQKRFGVFRVNKNVFFLKQFDHSNYQFTDKIQLFFQSSLKGVFFQTFWKKNIQLHHFLELFFLFELETSNVGLFLYVFFSFFFLFLFFFNCAKCQQKPHKFDMRYFIRTISKGWTLIKCVISSLYNLAETLHIYGKNSKDTHVAKN